MNNFAFAVTAAETETIGHFCYSSVMHYRNQRGVIYNFPPKMTEVHLVKLARLCSRSPRIFHKGNSLVLIYGRKRPR